jgi:predicted nucleotide-binding protein (sugar kinase/HSP70/actin superfamily)
MNRPLNRPLSPHYRTYTPRPFTKAERDNVTILFGGVHWRAERILQAVFENLGYKAQPLPPATRDDLLRGRELADIGQCCPTTFVTGNLANFLSKEVERIGPEAVTRDYVYLTAGSCGSCRFGQYHQSYELAVRNIGLDSFRLFLLAQTGLDQSNAPGDGLEINLPLTLGAVWAFLCTDILQDFEYQVRPYEVVPGATDAAVKAAVEEVYQAFRNRPFRGRKWGALAWHLTTDYFVAALKRARRHFEAIEVDRLRVKPKVKITGEFYLQSVEGAANYNIHHWLETEGAEVYPAAIAIWLDYTIRFFGQQFEDYRGIDRYARLKDGGLRLVSRVLRRTYERMRGVFADIPHELPDQYELRDLAAPYFHSRLSGGEGDMLVGKALWAHLHHKAHMICELSPYACMPNTMSIGAMSSVLGKYPDLLYAPLEIKGDAEVHALSRCQMILTEAKKRAQQEYEAALEKTGLTTEEARRRLDANPAMKKALYRVPHRGMAGTAANLVLALAGSGS